MHKRKSLAFDQPIEYKPERRSQQPSLSLIRQWYKKELTLIAKSLEIRSRYGLLQTLKNICYGRTN
jgi:hypothetical protein